MVVRWLHDSTLLGMTAKHSCCMPRWKAGIIFKFEPKKWRKKCWKGWNHGGKGRMLNFHQDDKGGTLDFLGSLQRAKLNRFWPSFLTGQCKLENKGFLLSCYSFRFCCSKFMPFFLFLCINLQKITFDLIIWFLAVQSWFVLTFILIPLPCL